MPGTSASEVAVNMTDRTHADPGAASPTLAARLTPPGRGAIAVVAIRGPGAWTVARDLFRPRSGSLPVEPGSASPRVGTVVGDHAVLMPTSDGVEFHTHGSPLVVDELLEQCRRRGVLVVPAEQFHPGDPLARLAAAELARAPTERTAAILLDQLHGAFARALAAIAADPRNAANYVQELVRYADLGRRLTRPWTVVLAGEPNVGKSSLLNALAGYRRSLVAATAGTTRDVVTASLAFDGWPVELADTAGVRAAEGLEAAGVRLADRARSTADLVVWVVDATRPVSAPPEFALLVANKCDLPDARPVPGAVAVSARTGAGLPELTAAIVARLVPVAPPPGAGVPFTPELVRLTVELATAVHVGDSDRVRRILHDLSWFGPA